MDRGRTGVRVVVGEHKRQETLKRDRLTASKEVDTKPIRTSGSPGSSRNFSRKGSGIAVG